MRIRRKREDPLENFIREALDELKAMGSKHLERGLEEIRRRCIE